MSDKCKLTSSHSPVSLKFIFLADCSISKAFFSIEGYIEIIRDIESYT